MFGEKDCSPSDNEDLCERFLSEDTYGLVSEIENLRGGAPVGPDGERMPFHEGRNFRQKRSLEVFEAIKNGTMASNANDMEKGLLLMSTYCTFCGSGGDYDERRRLREYAVNTMRSSGSAEASLEQQAIFVENLGTLCRVMQEFERESLMPDGYGIFANREVYEEMLLEETKQLRKMGRESLGPEGKEAALKAFKRSVQTLKKLGYISEGRR
jgi:hypothetical protein